MGAEWPKRPFKALTINYDVKRKPVKESERLPGPYPYYGASGIVDHVEGYLFDGRYLLIGEDGENLRTRQTPIAFMAQGKFWVNNHAHIVKANQLADTRFLMYAVLNSDIQSYLTGVVMPKLTQANLNKIMLPCPPLAVQVQVAGMLGALDDRITLLRETNDTLESMAMALFKSWFVDFDPVHAKMKGCAPKGLDEATAALFPDGLEASNLGWVPRGWRVGALGELVKIAYGKNLPKSKLLQTGYPVYGGNGPIGFSDKFLYESRQVLVACRGAASGKFNQSAPRAFITNNSLVLESDSATLLPFGYLKGCMACADLSPFVTGSAQPQITIENLNHFNLLVPYASVLNAFEAFSAPIEDKIEANNQQAQTLARLRDTLLGRLMSGQLRLPGR